MTRFVLVLFACANAFGGLEENVSSFKLENGMTWVVASRPGSSEVTALTYIDAGSAQEVPGITGISIVLARSAMKHAQKSGFDKARSHSGFDRMILTTTMPRADLEKWLRWDSERLRTPDLTAFEEERNRMLAEGEKRRVGGGFVLEEIARLAFLAHPYGQPPLGFASDMKALKASDGKCYLERYAVASNLVGVLIGDMSASETRVLIERHYSVLPKVPKPNELRTIEPDQRAERRVTLPRTKDVGVVVAFHRPAVGDPVFATWDVTSTVLAARLKRDLVDTRKLATRVMAHHGLVGMKYPGLMTVMAIATQEQSCQEIESAILIEIDKLKSAPVPDQELANSKKGWSEGFEKMRNEDLAVELADWQAMTNDWRSMFRYPEKTQAVSAEQIQRLAKQALIETNRTVGTCK